MKWQILFRKYVCVCVFHLCKVFGPLWLLLNDRMKQMIVLPLYKHFHLISDSNEELKLGEKLYFAGYGRRRWEAK